MYLSFSPLLFNSLHSSAICKASTDNHFTFLLFFFLEMVLFVTSCTMLGTLVHNFSGTLLTRSSPLNLFVIFTVNSNRIWFKSYLVGLVFSLVFFHLNLTFAMRSWWSEPQSTPDLVHVDCIQLLHLQLQRMKLIWFWYWPFGD